MAKINKFLALLLCMVMLAGMVPVQAFASGESPDNSDTVIETQNQGEEPLGEPQGENPVEEPQEEPQEEPAKEPTEEPASVTDVQVTGTQADVVEVVDGEGNKTYYASFDAAMNGEFGGGIYTYGGTYTFTLLEDTSSSGESWSLKYPKDGTTVNLTIDLNGHTIQGDSTKVVLSFTFGSKTSGTPGVVTITDSVGTGKITGGKQGVYFSGKDSTLNFNGGTITGNHGNSNGAGIYCGATALLNLNGGVITGNSVTNSNTNQGLGGGVCANQLNLNGTIITGNAANGSTSTLQSGRGGGIAVEITGTKGYSVVKINTNTVYGNTATNAGDDLMIAKNGLSGIIHTLVIGTENWYIDGWNGVSASKGQTDRYSEENPVPYTDGGFTDQYKINLGLKYVAPVAEVTYTVTYTDGVEDEVVFDDQTYTVKENDATPAFDGTPTRKGYVFDGWDPAVAETVTADATYTASWAECTHSWDDGVFDEDTKSVVCTCTVCGETKAIAVVARLESTGEYFATLQEAVTAADTYSKTLTGHNKSVSQTVTLVANTTECVKITYSPNKNNYYHYYLTIDLNGHTVTGDGTGSVFTVSRYTSFNYNLTVTFNDSVGTGVVTGGNTTGNGGAINVDSGKLCYVVVNGGTWTGNHADKNGGAIWSSGQTACPVTINGGVFSSNTAGGNGGAFHIRSLTMTGGTVTGNSAVNGGGLYSFSGYSQILNMTGGKIYGNTATTAGDDIIWRADMGKTTSYLTLVDAGHMGAEGVTGWFVDNADARYDAENPVEFTDYAKYTTQKTLVCLKAAAEKAPEVPAKNGNNVMTNLVKTICDSDADHVSVTSNWSSVNCQVFPTTSTPVWNAELGAWTIGVRLQSLTMQYVRKLEKANNNITHALVGESQMLATLKWDKAQQLWVTLDGQPLEVHATCKAKPTAPEFRQISSYQIQVYGPVGFENKLYAVKLDASSVTVGEVQGSRKDGFTVDVTVAIAEDDVYQSTWLVQRAPGRTLADYTYDWAKTPATITFTLKYTGDLNGTLYGNRHASNTNYDWVLSTNGKHFGKVGEAYLIPAEPAKPTQETVTDEFVKVICDSDPDRHSSVYGKWYPTCCKAVSNAVWNDGMNAWIVDVKIGSLYTMYVDQLEDANNGVIHELVDDTTSVYATLKWDVTAQQWVPTEPIELHTICRTAPLAPVYDQISGYQIKVHGDKDGNGVYGEKGETWTTSIPESGYTLSSVYGSREEGFYVDVTVTLEDGDLYQTHWIENCDSAHFYKYNWDKTEKTVTFTLRYNGSLTGTLYGNRNAANTNYDWVLDTTGKTWGVVSEAYVDKVMCTVQVVIYRNGNTTKPYKTVTLDKAAKGDTLDLTALNIGDYYSSANGYAFEGWFNDGRWNQYKAGQTVNGMDEIYINGWTNIICMVTDYQVVQMQIYRNGDTTKPYKTIALEKMLKGDTLDLTTLDIGDYYSSTYGFEFYGWFNDGRWNQYKAGKDVTGLEEIAINGWTNVICMVYDNQKVVVKAVTNGDKANAEVIFTGAAPKGHNLVQWLDANVEVAERTGYTLDKWYNWDWYGHKYEDTRTVNGWTNVYVTYTANTYTLTLDANGGTFPAAEGARSGAGSTTTVTVTYDQPVGELPEPVRDGYTFVGWFDENGNAVTADTVYKADGDMTLTAKWMEDEEEPTETPTETPSEEPTEKPTEAPTEEPTEKPTETPTETPSEEPTETPTEEPTEKPTEAPTEEPTEKPTEAPTEGPTEKPTETPTGESTEATTEKTTEQETTGAPETTVPGDPTSPKTGDNTVMMFTVMMLLSAAAIVFLVDRQRRMTK